MTLTAIAIEIGRTRVQTRKLLNKADAIGIKVYCKPGQELYNSQAVEAVKALIGQPHRKVSTTTNDWLSEHVNTGGTP
jgi:hypothetical protein